MPPLVCPRCRRVEDGRLAYGTLEGEAPLLRCPRCEQRYPVIDGVPIVPSDLDAWLREQAPVLLARRDLDPAVWALVLPQASEALRTSEALRRTYADPTGELVDAIRAVVPSLPGPLLDLGSGLGVYEHPAATGLDLAFGAARAYGGEGVVGDAVNPPFAAETFRSVLALNLLDSVAEPRVALGQADALLAPGGQLVLACAYAWRDDLTPPRERFTPDDLLVALRGEGGPLALPHLRYAVERVEDGLEWSLQVSPRQRHVYACQLVIARKAS